MREREWGGAGERAGRAWAGGWAGVGEPGPVPG